MNNQELEKLLDKLKTGKKNMSNLIIDFNFWSNILKGGLKNVSPSVVESLADYFFEKGYENCYNSLISNPAYMQNNFLIDELKSIENGKFFPGANDSKEKSKYLKMLWKGVTRGLYTKERFEKAFSEMEKEYKQLKNREQ
jgi:hypothetical protein